MLMTSALTLELGQVDNIIKLKQLGLPRNDLLFLNVVYVVIICSFQSQVVFLANAFEVDLETRPDDTVYERDESTSLE